MGSACCATDDVDKAETVEEQKRQINDEMESAVVTNTEQRKGGKKKQRRKGGKEKRESPGAEAASEFKIVIDKTGGRSLGVGVNTDDGETLHVDAVTGDLFQQWNDNHPHQAVKAGDSIIEVNGVRGDVNQLVAECWTNNMLEIVVRRSQ